MSEGPHARVLAIMGSGETSPTMVTIHKTLVARLGTGSHSAVLLDTPYAFQENASDISARAQAYFARSVGLKVTVISDADLPAAQNPGTAGGLAAIRLVGLGLRRARQPFLRAEQVARRSRSPTRSGTGSPRAPG